MYAISNGEGHRTQCCRAQIKTVSARLASPVLCDLEYIYTCKRNVKNKMNSPVIAVTRSLQKSSRALFAQSASPKLKLTFWLQSILNFPLIQKMLDAGNPENMLPVLERDRELFGVLFWPLLDVRWQATRRLQALQDHYREAAAFGSMLVLGTDSTRTLLTFDGDLSNLRVCIENQTFFRREGQLVLSIFHEDSRVFSVAFLLARVDGVLAVYVGAVQGVKQPEESNLYKTITKDCFGLRPRDLTISMFLILCQAMDVKRIFAVQDAYRAHNHAYFGAEGGSKVLANYDEIWKEREATETADGFFELAGGSEVKDLQTVASKKRSMYRKRYQLLTDSLAAMRTVLQTGQPARVVMPKLAEPSPAQAAE